MTLCSMVHEQTRLIHGDTPCDALQRTPGPPIQRGSTVLLPSCEALYDGGKVTYGRVGLSTQRTLRDALRDLENADEALDRKSTRLNSSHSCADRMPSSA